MKLSPCQKEVANHPARFKVVIAGRRFGKTFLSIRELCYQARMPNREIFYITSSYRAAKMIVWKPLKRRLIDLRWVKKINESELSILLKNGSTISLKGAENPDSLRGPSLSYCVIDEAADVDANLWYEVIRPALADQRGGAMFIGTPKGKSNWTYDLYVKGLNLKQTAWKSFQYTTIQGGFVDQEEIDAAREDMSERQFNQEFLATFETYENRVAWGFDRTESVIDVPKDVNTSIIHVGMDFNVSPATAAISVKHTFMNADGTSLDCMVQIDEIMMHSSNTDEMVIEIQNRYPKSKVFVYPDPSGNQRRTSAGGNTDHKILENAGFILKAPRKHDPIRDRVNAINAQFQNANSIRRLFIVNTCKHTIECLDKFTFKEGTQVPDKSSGYDHMFDALSYCIAYLFPIKKKVEHKEPQRWGHAIN